MPFSFDVLCDVAQRALDKGHLEEADALFHAIVMLEEDRYEGYLGMAECAEQRGRSTEAVRILVAAAERLADQPSPAAGYILLGRALELDPGRLDLHLDIAQLQAKDGDVHGARSRVQQLASAYIHEGAWRQAQEVLAFAASWDPQPLVAGEIELVIDVESDSIPIGLDDLDVIHAVPTTLRGPKEKTMVAETVLRFPDGSPMPTKKQPWAVAAARKSPTSRPRKRPSTGRTVAVPRPAGEATTKGTRSRDKSEPARARARRLRAEAITARTQAVARTKIKKLPRP